MTYKSIILLSCLIISSCKTAPTTLDNNQPLIPHFDYEMEQNKYMRSHRHEIDKKNVSVTLNNAHFSIKNYLRAVGKINECSKYSIDSRNLASLRQFTKPIDTVNARKIAEQFANKVKNYANSVDSKFDWDWRNGADIQNGKDAIDKSMGSLYLEAELKYAICRTAEASLSKPKLRIVDSNYEIIFTKGSISQLTTKASAIMRGECGKELRNFVFFPNGYERLAFNTFNHSSMGLATKVYTNKKSNMYYNDKKRYAEAYRGSAVSRLFEASPCNDFKKEYYILLKNSDIKFQQY